MPITSRSKQHLPRLQHHSSIWQPTVPRWEKMFCSSVGSVPWEKLVETKKYMYLYDKVVNWNDSAGEEAFDNAKSRFWSEINGLPFDIPFPDPDLYIDDIDWNSSIDPELILDLERDAIVPSDEENDAEVVILGDALLVNQSFFCIGWGDIEEDASKQAELVSGAQVNVNENSGATPAEHNYASYYAAKEYERKNDRNDSRRWNQRPHCRRGAGRNRRRRKEENMAHDK